MNNIKKFKTLSQMEKFDENPFREGLVTSLSVNSRKRLKKITKLGVNDALLDTDTGEIKSSEGVLLADTQWVDEEHFFKLYITHMGILFDLTKIQLKLVRFIMTQLQWNKDFFYFDMKEFQKEYNFSDPSVYSALAILCDIGLIARSDVHFKYYINPVMMFKGDRIIVAKEYIRGVSPQDEGKPSLKNGSRFIAAMKDIPGK